MEIILDIECSKHYRTYLSGGYLKLFKVYFRSYWSFKFSSTSISIHSEGPALRGLYKDDIGTTSGVGGLNWMQRYPFYPIYFMISLGEKIMKHSKLLVFNWDRLSFLCIKVGKKKILKQQQILDGLQIISSTIWFDFAAGPFGVFSF